MEEPTVAQIEVRSERQTPDGWTFEVQVSDAEATRRLDVLLSWVDYDYWSRGAHAPEKVVEALVRYLSERSALDETPDRFDASMARRRHEGLDEALRGEFR